MDIDQVIKTDDFKKAMWEWFDKLPKQEKDRFKYYTADMADIYFYNKFYKALVAQQNRVSVYETEG